MTQYTQWQKFLITLTQMFGTVWFGLIRGEDIAPDESTSAFVWRRNKTGWIKVIDWLARNPTHCKEAYMSEKCGTQNAPEYRQKFDEESA